MNTLDREEWKAFESSLRDVQETIDARWGSSEYSAEYNADQSKARDFKHALIHVHKAAGKLSGVVDDFDHGFPLNTEEAAKWLADLVICAVRMASKHPNEHIDMLCAVSDRIGAKFPPKAKSQEAKDAYRERVADSGVAFGPDTDPDAQDKPVEKDR